jgi:hypothetical protein
MELKRFGLAAMALAAMGVLTVRPVAAQLYSENFAGAPGGDFTPVGWDDTSSLDAGMFDATGNAITNEAITPDGLDTGCAFVYRNTNGVQAIWTTEFAPINAAAGGGVDISWWQTEQGITAGSTVDVHPAVQVGGQWYAWQRAFSTADVQSPWRRQLMAYSPAKANWLALTLGTGSATLGAAPAVDLSGNITGLGLVTVMNNVLTSYDAAGVLLANQVGRETVYYDYIEIATHVIPGDVNGVGGATIDDYNIIKANYGTNVTMRSQGDLNQDRVVNVLDFREWKANVPPAVSAGLTAPEPGAGLLALSGLAIVAARRRLERRSIEMKATGSAGGLPGVRRRSPGRAGGFHRSGSIGEAPVL